MTPQEKAKELVDKFEVSFAGVISNDEDWEILAKQCALIAVDEILNGSRLFYIEDYDYWQKVKQEIEKL